MRNRKLESTLNVLLAGLIVLFAFAASAEAQSEKVIYRFIGTGLQPGFFLLYRQGNLYGLATRTGSAAVFPAPAALSFNSLPIPAACGAKKCCILLAGPMGSIRRR
jgi:hypothetical protein